MPGAASFVPLRISPSRSCWLGWFLVASHGLALAGLLLGPWPWWGQALLGALVLALLLLAALGPWLRRLPWSIVAAQWDGQGPWTLTLSSGAQVEGRLLADSLVTLPLILLNFRAGRWRRLTLILPPDALPADSSRRLRAALRMAPQARRLDKTATTTH